MQVGETRHTVKKRHDHGALIEALVVRPVVYLHPADNSAASKIGKILQC